MHDRLQHYDAGTGVPVYVNVDGQIHGPVPMGAMCAAFERGAIGFSSRWRLADGGSWLSVASTMRFVRAKMDPEIALAAGLCASLMRLSVAIQFAAAWLLQFSIGNPLAVVLGTVVTTAALNAYDASLLKMGIPGDVGKYGRRFGPLEWFLFHLLVWGAAYPFYMFRRADYGPPHSTLIQPMVMGLFIGAWWGSGV